MTPEVSDRLHAYRLCAALLVLMTHAAQLGYTGPGHGALEGFGRLGVIAFFVLSGVVIAYVVESRHDCFRDYLAARLARLHSVLLPAMLLTFCADLAGRAWMPELYVTFPSPTDARTLAGAPLFPAFLYQGPGLALRWLSNSPLWSIAYEYWYYMLFGAWVYARGQRRWVLLLAAAAIAGTKILLLFPLWLAGVWLYRARVRIADLPSRPVALAGIAGILVLLLLCLPQGYAMLGWLREWGREQIGQNFSAHLPWDLFLLLPVGLVMAAILHPATPSFGPRLAAAIAWLADATFSIYCYHLPLLLLLRASGFYDSRSAWQSTLAALAVLAACVALSLLTERRKQPWLRAWRRLLGLGPRPKVA